MWRNYYSGTQALIFVVDSDNRERINEAKVELAKILSDVEMKDAVVLVFANKSDIEKCMDVYEITEQLGLKEMQNRAWHVERTSAITGKDCNQT